MKKNCFMKKSNILKFLIYPIIVIGCNSTLEEQTLVPIDSTFEMVGQTLKFSSLEDYENYFENSEKVDLPVFQSLKSVFNSNPSKSEYLGRLSKSGIENLEEFKDSKILELLDENGFVIIHDYLIQLDFENGEAYVTKDLSLREKILNRDFNNLDINKFSFEDDVLGILFGEDEVKNETNSYIDELVVNENLRISSGGCPGSYPPGSSFPSMVGSGCDSKKCEFTSIWQEGNWEFKAEAKHVYQAAAVYFRLKTEVAQYRRSIGGGSWSNYGSDNMKITYWGSFTPKNRSWRPLSGCYDECQGCWPPPANKQKVQRVYHEAGRRLTQYNLYGIIDVFLGGGNYGSGYHDTFQLFNIKRD
ncbi:hypothetical protein MM236_12180 [Belliella sp. DSM 107340]|uniref:Uncharacterized protein n=1 Tax=Belliella calami TaxID=2923436 RepID=A0ABS9UR80_9BACT|nr:hypothetical protein [Belliella calami]MCH7398753.1 hypothetical protein [Belliella calami]